jgi:hypothetical protein
MTTKGYIIGSIIIFGLFVMISFSAGKWASKTAEKNQNRIDAAFSILEK